MSERVIAFIPAFNEAKRIAAVVSCARPLVAEVVVVDDGSVDDTTAVAEAAGAKVLRHARNQGKGAAILTALDSFRDSDAAFAVFLDADGQHDPSEIPKFLQTARETGAGIVVGTRMQDTRTMPWLRRVANGFTSRLTSRLARQTIPDSQCGYRLLSHAVLEDLKLHTAHFETETEMLIQAGRAGRKIASVPIRTIYEATRSSRIRPLSDTLRFFKLIKKYW